MSSTFDGLYIARSGVLAARTNLNIVGHNISNAATDGYTRQRVNQSAIPSSESAGFWSSTGATCGNGVNTTDTSQLRDAFLDSEYRLRNAQSGETSIISSALDDLQNAFTYSTTSSSSSKTSIVNALSNEFSTFLSQLQTLNANKSADTADTVKNAAKSLLTKLNQAAKDIETARAQQSSNLTEHGINGANDLLKGIAALNNSIEQAEVGGDSALELKDQRNLMLDQLSKYASVKIAYTSKSVGSGRSVDQMSVYLSDANGNTLTGADGKPLTLVDGDQYAKFSVSQDKLTENGNAASSSFDITHIRLSGLTKDGASFPGTTTGSTYTIGTAPNQQTLTIPANQSYSNMTDLKNAITADPANASLSVTIGVSSDGTQLTFKDSNGNSLPVTHASGGYDLLSVDGMKNSDLKGGSFSGYLQLLNESGEYDTANASTPTTTTRGFGYYTQLLDSIAQKFAGTLNKVNSTNDAGDNNPLISGTTASGAESSSVSDITAKNIHISSQWKLTTSKDKANSGDNTDSSYSNITTMIAALNNTEEQITSAKGVDIFDGTIKSAFANVSTKLGQDVSSVQKADSTNSTRVNDVETSREALSTVSMDEEAVDMVQFNQALNAASRFMTAVDECLQTIISSMGVAGRG